MLGKLRASMIKAARPQVPLPILRYLTDHSVDIYLTTEDLPDPENQVVLRDDGRLGVRWRANNLAPHAELVKRVGAVMRAAGYPLVFSERMNIATSSHQCGTAVMGTDPATSVVDPTGRTHDLDNLWITDSSVFPSSTALNPALTIAANALRVASLGALTS